MKARVFKKVRNFEKEATLLKSLKFRCEKSYIDNAHKCFSRFTDTREIIPEWSGTIYAEYYYNKNNKIIDIIALW